MNKPNNYRRIVTSSAEKSTPLHALIVKAISDVDANDRASYSEMADAVIAELAALRTNFDRMADKLFDNCTELMAANAEIAEYKRGHDYASLIAERDQLRAEVERLKTPTPRTAAEVKRIEKEGGYGLDMDDIISHAEKQEREIDRLRAENAKLRGLLGEALVEDAITLFPRIRAALAAAKELTT